MPTRTMKYGPFGSDGMIDMPVGASEVFAHLSGCFVKADDSGRIEVAGATDVDILGWAITYAQTASSTEGRTTVTVDTNLSHLFIMPAYNGGSAVTESSLTGAVGESFDIYVASNVQYANVGASSVDILLGYAANWVAATTSSMTVKINPNKVVYTTH